MNKSHYFLISALVCSVAVAEVTEAKAKGTEADISVSTMPISCIVVSERTEFGIAQLAKAQQAAQSQFFKRVVHNSVEVVDVLVNSISYLGHMTEEEFHGKKSKEELIAEAVAIAQEAGVTLNEIPDDVAVNDADAQQ